MMDGRLPSHITTFVSSDLSHTFFHPPPVYVVHLFFYSVEIFDRVQRQEGKIPLTWTGHAKLIVIITLLHDAPTKPGQENTHII